MIVIQLQMKRGHKIYWSSLCKSKERFFKTYEVKGSFFEKKTSSGWKNRFWPIFLVSPVMLLKTQLFEKELFWHSFLVLCGFKNLSEQFITGLIFSWIFLYFIKLHFVRTYKADGDFSRKMLYSRWFWPVFFRISEYRDIRKQFHWPKKDSNKCSASYKIISGKTEWMLKTIIFEKKILFQWKNTFTYFSCKTELCRCPWQLY